MPDLPDVYIRFTGADPKIRGESSDAAYPGKDGWLSIKSFSFGFGWTDTSESSLEDMQKQLAAENSREKRIQIQEKISALQKKLREEGSSSGTTGQNGSKGDDAQQLKQRDFSFTRNPGVSSRDILLHLKRGATEVLGADLVVCRAAGVELPDGTPKDAKTPFLRFKFAEVHLTKCQVQVSRDGAPTETVEFWYKEVTMETVWTDNETGSRLPGGTNKIHFRFDDKSDPEFVAAQDDDDDS